jgi:uncharacterized membrane protein YobD (UPF0266 family)
VSSAPCLHVLFLGSLTDNSPVSTTTFLIITVIFTSYRCFARISKKIWGHDDSVALFSCLIFIPYVVGSYNVCFTGAARWVLELTIYSPA